MPARKPTGNKSAKKPSAGAVGSLKQLGESKRTVRVKGTGDTKFFAPASRDVTTAPKETAKGNDAPPARERGSYDSDSAFKLYLREI